MTKDGGRIISPSSIARSLALPPTGGLVSIQTQNFHKIFTRFQIPYAKVTVKQTPLKSFPMVRGRKTNLVIYLTPEERKALESWQFSKDIRAGLTRRGQIILMLADGASITDISRIVGIRRRFIYKWVQRFRDEGVPGLIDRPGRGRAAHESHPLSVL